LAAALAGFGLGETATGQRLSIANVVGRFT
jgi:hypothetical protein